MSWTLFFQIVLLLIFLLVFSSIALSIYKDFRIAMDARRVVNQDLYRSNKNSEE